MAFNEPDLMNQKVWLTVESRRICDDNARLGFKGVILDSGPAAAVIPIVAASTSPSGYTA